MRGKQTNVEVPKETVPITLSLRALEYSPTGFSITGLPQPETPEDVYGLPVLEDGPDLISDFQAPRSICVAVLSEHPKLAVKAVGLGGIHSAGGKSAGAGSDGSGSGSTGAAKIAAQRPIPQRLFLLQRGTVYRSLLAPVKTLEWSASIRVPVDSFPIYVVPYTRHTGQWGRYCLEVRSTTPRLDLVEDRTGHIQAAAAAAAAADKEASKAAGRSKTPPRRATSRRAAKKRSSEASLNSPMGGNAAADDVGESSTLTRYQIAQAKKKDREARRKLKLANINGEIVDDGDPSRPQQGSGKLWDTPVIVAPVSREASRVSRSSRRSVANTDPLAAGITTALATALRGSGGGSAAKSPRKGKGRAGGSAPFKGGALAYNAHGLALLTANAEGADRAGGGGESTGSPRSPRSAPASASKSTSPHTRKVRRRKPKGGLSKF